MRVFLWIPRNDRWAEVRFSDWTAFREIWGKVQPLPGAGEGEHFVAVCVIPDGEVRNIMIQRHVVTGDGTPMGIERISDRSQHKRVDQLHVLPQHAAERLLDALPGPIAKDKRYGVHAFLSTVGLSGTGAKPEVGGDVDGRDARVAA
jgi:hypothetical protein